MPYTTLISIAELAALSDTADLVIVDCRFSLADPTLGETEYLAGHLPGAVYAHLDRDLSSAITSTSGRHPLPDSTTLGAKLAQWGVGEQSQVVAYDNSGGAFAARLWWLARWLGHPTVAVLDGGYDTWVNAGQPLSTDIPNPSPTTFTAKPDASKWLTSDRVASLLQAGGITLVDARDPERYRGDVEPIDPVAGHVPGAINFPFKGNLKEGKFQESAALAARFNAALGETPAEHVVQMCGSGVTACHNILAMEHAGLKGSRLYAGSWSEWIRDPREALRKGES